MWRIRAKAGSREEDRDGKIYRSLVDTAEAFEKDESAVLPRALTRQREIWWKQSSRTPPGERHGNRFELVSELLRQSGAAPAHRALVRDRDRGALSR